MDENLTHAIYLAALRQLALDQLRAEFLLRKAA